MTDKQPMVNFDSINEEKCVDSVESVELGNGDVEKSIRVTPQLVKRGLTEVSAMFDRNGKGYLDDTERALRRMDSTNQGFLGIDKVCMIFESLQAEQERSSQLLEALRVENKKSLNLKKGVIALAFFSVLLALANVGTSFAVAKLTKDMEVQNGNLIASGSGLRLGTTSKLVTIDMESLDSSRRRRLQAMQTAFCEADPSDNNPSVQECTIQGIISIDAVEMLHSELREVERLQLQCNGNLTKISGDVGGTPSFIDMGGQNIKMFPHGADQNIKYSALQTVTVPRNTETGKPGYSCAARFGLNFWCPDRGQALPFPEFAVNECTAISFYQPTMLCPSNPVICGERPASAQGGIVF